VLDCFSGSGTTLVVANQLQRRWIGIDNSGTAIETTLRRFAHGSSPMGDFVQKADTHEKQASLWSDGTGIDKTATCYWKAIKDFSLYVSSDKQNDEIMQFIQQWIQEIS